MSPRTYLPTLIQIVRRSCVYTARYDAIIRSWLPPGALPAYEAYRLACDALLEQIDTNVIDG